MISIDVAVVPVKIGEVAKVIEKEVAGDPISAVCAVIIGPDVGLVADPRTSI